MQRAARQGIRRSSDRYYPTIYSRANGRTPFSFLDDAFVRPRGDINPVTGHRERLRLLSVRDGRRLPARGRDLARAADPRTSRLILGELGQQRSVRRRDHRGNHSYLEQRFRLSRQPYARQLEGASTSGCQTLALQLRNPTSLAARGCCKPTRSISAASQYQHL